RSHRRRQRARCSPRWPLHPGIARRTPPLARGRRRTTKPEGTQVTVRRRRWTAPSGLQREVWVVDVQATGKDGRLRRVQRVSPLQNRRAAEKLEHELRQELLDADERQPVGESPLLAEFATEFIDTYARTNNKPSEVESKRMILRVHLVPEL